MNANFVSTSYLGNATLPAMAQTQSALTNLGVEASTGQYADLGLQLGSQSGYELSLKNENDLLQTLTTGNSLVTTSLSTAQDALNSILTEAQSASSSLTTWTSESTTSDSSLQTIGTNALQSLISSSNASANGVYVFGGVNSSVAPMNDYSTVTTAVSSAFNSYFGFEPTDAAAASVTSSQMQSFLSSSDFTSLFSGAGWAATWSNASSVNTSAEIAPGETVDTSTNANQPGFQQLAEAYSMLAVFGGSQLSSDAQQAVATAATSLVNDGVSSTTATEASVGATAQSVINATSAMASQMTILQTQIGNLDNVNSQQVAVQLNNLSTQLETAYQLTAQLQKMTLAQYLPVA